MVTFEVAGYVLCADRLYDPETHMWVHLHDDQCARLGLDPLGRETSGDVVALSLEPAGVAVAPGESLGDLEAAKFVGPLLSPVSGVVAARNEAVLADPSLLNVDPATHWLVEVQLAEQAVDELEPMLQGEAQVAPWFAAEVERFRIQGAIAE